MNNYDLTGLKFNHLLVLRQDESTDKNSRWLCQCDCGNIVSRSRQVLIKDRTFSCGCLDRRKGINRTHGMSKTPIYKVWANLRKRCKISRGKDYPHYKGKGITVCEEWDNDFLSFYNWSIQNGYKKGLTIDRIDVNGNYEPSNCRWITNTEQQTNKAKTVKICVDGEEIPLAVLCRERDFPYKKAHRRYRNLQKRNQPIEIDKIIF